MSDVCSSELETRDGNEKPPLLLSSPGPAPLDPEPPGEGHSLPPGPPRSARGPGATGNGPCRRQGVASLAGGRRRRGADSTVLTVPAEVGTNREQSRSSERHPGYGPPPVPACSGRPDRKSVV